jgi:hypothetical protein
MSNIKEISGLIRDIGFILGVPFLSILVFKLYNQYVLLLKEQNTFLKETQYDKALQLIKSQKELFEIERSNLELKVNQLQSNLSEKNIMTISIQERLEQIKIEEIKLEKKKRITEDFKVIYNNLFSDLKFVADFKTMFFDGNSFSYIHFGGMNKSVSFYRNFAAKLEKIGLATYEPYCNDMESGVSIDLTDQGIKFKELLFN